MAFSDIVIFNENARSAYAEVDAQNNELWNEATSGAIRLDNDAVEGSFKEMSFISETNGIVRERNPNSYSTISEVAIQQDEEVDVKVARGTPPTRIVHSDWTWIQMNPADAGAAYGRQRAVKAFSERLNTVLGVGVAALANDGRNVFDATGLTDSKASLGNLVNAAAKMGDRAHDLVAWVMHSKSLHDIYAAAVANGSSLFQIGNVYVTTDGFGRLLIMTDSPSLFQTSGSPSVTSYNILGLQEDALRVKDSNDLFSNIYTPNGTDTLKTTIQSEWTYTVGARGFKWDMTKGQAPANSSLLVGANWLPVAESHKNLPGVLLKVL